MIVNISPTGTNMKGLIDYLSSEEGVHVDPHLVGGSLGYTGPLDDDLRRHLPNDLNLPLDMNPGYVMPKGHVWSAALVLEPQDGNLSRKKWAEVSEDFMNRMKYNDPGVRWAAVNHGQNKAGQDHVHIAMNLVKWHGVQVNTWMGYAKAQKVVAELELAHGLTVRESRMAGVGRRAYKRDDHRMSEREGREPRLVELERRVRACAAGANTQEQFVQNLLKDGITFRPRKDTNGKDVGYSVHPSNVPDKYWWSGSSLARDLSLPRLQLTWSQAPGKPVPESHIAATEELRGITLRAPGATPEQLSGMAHQLSNTLAATSSVVERRAPGELATMSRKVGSIAQRKTYTPERKPPALKAGMLFLQCTDPTGPVGQAVMIRQMMAASRAVLEAHLAHARAKAPSGEARIMTSTQPEDEVLESAITVGATVGAMAVETMAQRSKERANPGPREGWEAELWDAKTIAKFRVKDEVERTLAQHQTPPAKATLEQQERIRELGTHLGIDAVDAVPVMTSEEAARMIRTLEFAVGPEVPRAPAQEQVHGQDPYDFLSDLERKAAERASAVPVPLIPEQAGEQRVEAATQPQRYALRGLGHDPDGVTRAEADLVLSRQAASVEEARKKLSNAAAAKVHLTPAQPAAKAQNGTKRYTRSR